MSTADLETMDCAHKAVKAVATRLGYPELKKEQSEAVLSFVQGKDVFVSLPTGYGKSLCYGVIPLVVDEMKAHKEPNSILLIVSPLISLMKDQVKHFVAKGVSAGYVSSEPENKDMQGRIMREYQLVFISPEALLGTLRWRALLCESTYGQKIVGFVVDEAHCVLKW